MQNIARIVLASSFIIGLSGCSIFDDLGRHMPVIGERCENWECITASGQAQSEAVKRAQQAGQAQPHVPLNGQQSLPASSTSLQAVPKAPAEPTPFDMSPEQLENSSAPAGY